MTHPLPPGTVISSDDGFGQRYDLELVLRAGDDSAATIRFADAGYHVSRLPADCAYWTNAERFCAWRPEL